MIKFLETIVIFIWHGIDFMKKKSYFFLATHVDFGYFEARQLMLFLNAESQVIHTDQKNILIRALTLRKHKGESSSKNAKIVTSGEGSRKRYFSIYYL